MSGIDDEDRPFHGARFEGAGFEGSDHGGADGNGTDGNGADLGDADGGGADLGDADGGGADFEVADYGGAGLGGAGLGSAIDGGADDEGARFEAECDASGEFVGPGSGIDDGGVRGPGIRGSSIGGAGIRGAGIGGAGTGSAGTDGAVPNNPRINGGAHIEFHSSAVPDDVDLSRVWVNVAAHVWHSEPGRFERLARRVLRSPGLARALATTPSLLLGWVIATAVVLAAGAAATAATGLPCVALLAPAVAAAGIAYAYGPGIDPAWELSCSMAVSDRMVLLVRALTVFGFNAAIGIIASAVSVRAVGITFGWLVPMTAVSCLALASATATRSANAGVAIGLTGWCITVLAGRVGADRVAAAVTNSALILPYLTFAALCCVVVLYTTRIPKTGRPWTPHGI
jgi:hypothetical protein